ncbi:MAG: histidine--tRNA ligase [Bacteroidota bacterium]|jgi:histidyl-tRNA synthetase
MIKPTLAKGTRDFGPKEAAQRQYLFDVLRQQFGLYGFQALETPAMENLATLTGKYGEEGDQLMFHILNSGNFFDKLNPNEPMEYSSALPFICEKALRYDLTVPFARYVSMNRSTLSFPFRRYQMQPVWRADRPQKGRYREFYQCDIDIIGSRSILNEAEVIQLISRVFHILGIPVVIRLNNRKLLEKLAAYANCTNRFKDLTLMLDKLDKVAWADVKQTFIEKGFNDAQLKRIEIALSQNTLGELAALMELEEEPWLQDFRYLLNLSLSGESTLKTDLSLARGLTYYTGTILEVQVADGSFSPSIGGGGRYDDLTGMFGFPGMSGFGFSFGADRIYDVMQSKNLFPDSIQRAPVCFLHTGNEEQKVCMHAAEQLRSKGIPCLVYPDISKLRKQFDYANQLGAHWVVVVGENELQQSNYSLKNMQSGEQHTLSIQQLSDQLSAFFQP